MNYLEEYNGKEDFNNRRIEMFRIIFSGRQQWREKKRVMLSIKKY